MAMTTSAKVGRVGGFAMALGFGAAVATGLAASASCAPSDPAEQTAGPAVRADARDTAVPRSVAVSRRHASDTGASPAAAVARLTTEPAAVVSAPVRAAVTVSVPDSPLVTSSTPTPVTAPIPARQNPRRSSVAVQEVEVAQTATVAPATASNPISNFIDGIKSIFCDPRGRRITIYKRTHFAIPNSFGFFIQKVSGTGTFTANSTYDLGDEDQWDWNKFTGIAFTPLEPDRNSVMVGWRYNLISKEFEIAPFYNVDKARILPTPQDIISIPVDQTFQYNVDYDGVTLTYGDKTVFKAFPKGLTPNVWTAARVSGWFGGNEVAPRTISYFLKID